MRRFVGRLSLLAWLVVALGLVGATACGSGGVPLQRATSVPAQLAGANDQQVENAIAVALAKHHWQVVEKVPGRYTAELAERGYRLKIEVVYGPPGIVINYVDSENLRYKQNANGTETIHRKYPLWVRNLATDIQMALMHSPGAAPLVPAPPAGPAPAPVPTTAS